MKRTGILVLAAALASCTLGLAVVAAPAKVEDAKKGEGLAAAREAKFTEGRYRLPDGNPTYNVDKDYKVDWGTWQGFRRYHDACHVCHGPNAAGGSFAPALAESLQTMSYEDFVATVSSGRSVNRGGTEYVMPSFAANRDVMCYLDDIYTYIKARSTGALPGGRPPAREDISDEAKNNAKECLGE